MTARFAAALWAEALKARRSRLPALTALGFSLAPLVGGLFMLILENPERARRWGLIGAKAQLAAGVADWPTLLSLLAQATAVGGALLFGLVATWVFGREAVDGTAKDLLALPTPREAIVAAKFTLVAAWCAILAGLVWGLGIAVGSVIGLPGGSVAVVVHGGVDLLGGAGLTLALVTPVAFVASASRGYLGPMGLAVLTLFLAQIVAATGWGGVFPWSVPALFTGLAGPRDDLLTTGSYAIVAATSLAGLAATFLWWRLADQP
jgi:ABC-2 type transport system permease protein